MGGEPEIVSTIAELRCRLAEARNAGGRVGLVPTMGALHEGHLSLVRETRARCGTTVVSIFVNPTQFGPNEDFARYPRTFESDCAKLAGLADVIFAPSVAEMYPTRSPRLSTSAGRLWGWNRISARASFPASRPWWRSC